MAQPEIQQGPTNLEHHNLVHYFMVALAEGACFSILPNPFFHSATNLKELAAQPGIDPHPSRLRAPQHQHYTTVIFLFYVIFFFHS